MSAEHEPTEQPNWETKIVCECGERCSNWMEFYRHRGNAYRAQVQNRDAVLRAFDGEDAGRAPLIARLMDEQTPDVASREQTQ